jgi:hypothetical protein
MVPSRRQTLRASAGLAAALAGCLGSTADPGGSTTTDDPPATTTTKPTEAGECGDGYDPLPQAFDVVEYGSLAGFELSVEPETVPVNGEFEVHLRNASGEERTTGNRRKFDVQRDTGNGWATIYGAEGRVFWTDEGIPHAPGEGFTWQFGASPSGMTGENTNPPFAVCDPVAPGSYRFVYWGLTPPAERDSDSETEHAVGVRFEVVE